MKRQLFYGSFSEQEAVNNVMSHKTGKSPVAAPSGCD
ncbi:hypothetical protein HCH_05541 [Hahella chejuensis KCTC 2396]|uniref:Uncharacterized protein n=1 Tax=Hahella chejuensis (strain KCTC 2396) TaxID=349521 RepID=Q2SAX2_HAHCH|nr:hypothetical protein HCH_05541 [Hahella chejuensis KCTC 2396]